MSDAFIRFNSWTGGDAGRIDPSLAPANTWYGTNVTLYGTGLIGPRWGLKKITLTDTAGAPITTSAGNGPRGFATIGPNLCVVADRMFMAPIASAMNGATQAVTFPPYLAAPQGWVTIVAQTNELIYALVDGALYQHNTGAVTTTAVTTPTRFSFVRRWGLYCVGVDATIPYRLYFSKVDDTGFSFSEWPVNNYIDVGDNEPITAIVPLYNSLFVGKKSGWWAITGVIQLSESVRQISTGDGPVDPRGACVTTDNRIAYWPRSPNPAFFNGSTTNVLLDHETVPYDPIAAQAVAAAPSGRTTLFGFDEGGQSRALSVASVGGVSYYTFGERLSGFAPDVVENGYALSHGYVLAAKQTQVAGETVAVYAWKIDPERPPLASDLLGSYGDDSLTPVDAGFTTRAYYDGQGRDMRVRSVTVRFRAWGVGSSANKLQPGFTVSVEAIAPFEDASSTSSSEAWRIPYGQAPVGGSDFTARFAIGDQGYGAGFRITVGSMVGVAIRDIVVGVDMRGQRV